MAEHDEPSDMENGCFDYEHFCKLKKRDPRLHFQDWLHHEGRRQSDPITARLIKKEHLERQTQMDASRIAHEMNEPLDAPRIAHEMNELRIEIARRRINGVLAPLFGSPPPKRRPKAKVEHTVNDDPRLCKKENMERKTQMDASRVAHEINDPEARDCKRRITALLAPLLGPPPPKRRPKAKVEHTFNDDPRLCQAGALEDAMEGRTRLLYTISLY